MLMPLEIQKFQNKKFQAFTALLIFISLFTFQSFVHASVKELTAEQYHILGFEEYQKGNLDQALTAYIKAISLGLESAGILNDMGILYEQLGISDRAENVYQKAIEVDPNFLPAYMNLGYLYQKQGNNEKAFEYFKKRYDLSAVNDPWRDIAKTEFLKIHPEYAKPMIELEAQKLSGDVIRKKQDEFYERVSKSKEYCAQAKRAFKKKKYQDALIDYNKALVLTPRNPEAVRGRNQVLLELTKKNVREHSEQAIQLLESGDSVSARNEIQKILTRISNEPVLISK